MTTPCRAVRALVLGGAALTLSACFDIDHSVRIDGSGGGDIRIAIITDPLLAEEAEFENILTTEDTVVREYVEDGQFIREETLSFDSIEEVTLADSGMSVVETSATLWGWGPTSARFEQTFVNADDDAVDELGILDTVFEDNFYTFSVSLPGWVRSADAVDINGEVFEPVRSGGTATWTIPMARMLTAGEITFGADFTGFFTFPEASESTAAEESLAERGYMGLLPRTSE